VQEDQEGGKGLSARWEKQEGGKKEAKIQNPVDPRIAFYYQRDKGENQPKEGHLGCKKSVFLSHVPTLAHELVQEDAIFVKMVILTIPHTHCSTPIWKFGINCAR
jgi:hypothetical protein